MGEILAAQGHLEEALQHDPNPISDYVDYDIDSKTAESISDDKGPKNEDDEIDDEDEVDEDDMDDDDELGEEDDDIDDDDDADDEKGGRQRKKKKKVNKKGFFKLDFEEKDEEAPMPTIKPYRTSSTTTSTATTTSSTGSTTNMAVENNMKPSATSATTPKKATDSDALPSAKKKKSKKLVKSSTKTTNKKLKKSKKTQAPVDVALESLGVDKKGGKLQSIIKKAKGVTVPMTPEELQLATEGKLTKCASLGFFFPSSPLWHDITHILFY
jgi:hypothetical protein